MSYPVFWRSSLWAKDQSTIAPTSDPRWEGEGMGEGMGEVLRGVPMGEACIWSRVGEAARMARTEENDTSEECNYAARRW